MSNIPNLFPYTLGLSSVSQKTTLSKISTKGSKIKIQELFLENTFQKHYTPNPNAITASFSFFLFLKSERLFKFQLPWLQLITKSQLKVHKR